MKSRQHKQCGGVGLFIRNSLKYKLRDDLCIDTPDVIESIFIELDCYNMVIGCVYRPPGSDVAVFTSYIDTILSKINKEKKKCYIAGDFNINLLNHKTHVHTSDYLNCIFSHHFFPTINRPTRISATSATLIDNIITNVYQSQLVPSILYADVSDHLPIVIQTNFKLPKIQTDKYQYRRFFSENNKLKFTESLQYVNWDHIVTDSTAPDDGYKTFSQVFIDIYNLSFPLTKVNITRKNTPRKPWMTNGLVRCCIKKEKLYKKRIRNPTDDNITAYKIYRNKLNKIIRAAENAYYIERFDEYKLNIKQTWNQLDRY